MVKHADIPLKWRWLPESRYGLFIHWGPYAEYEPGEQVMFREHLDPVAYINKAKTWNPAHYDPHEWAAFAKRAGFRYACLTTRHHDGYCLWDTQTTDYSSAAQSPGRDFVGEFIQAFRSAGLRIGLYYSLLDWRIPAYFDGPAGDPKGWEVMRQYIHTQVEELLTQYGTIDYFWFDGVWPRTRKELEADILADRMRALQPNLLINNRLGDSESGDVGTPEHHIAAEDRLWESCQVSTWRLWGFAKGERWRNTDILLDMLCECAHKNGNLLLNVGPQADGQLPLPFVERALEIGQWLEQHGEAVYGTDGGDVTEFVTHGWQTTKDNNLYLILRFWDGQTEFRLADLHTRVLQAQLLTTGQELSFKQNVSFDQKDDILTLYGLPVESPTPLFPVIKLVCDGKPDGGIWAKQRLWSGDPTR
ncbi:MAG: alpha-L-fucosidase, partial [Anaerolineales bacterium]